MGLPCPAIHSQQLSLIYLLVFLVAQSARQRGFVHGLVRVQQFGYDRWVLLVELVSKIVI